MKSPSIVTKFQAGAWTVSYIGDDAEKAIQAHRAATDANDGVSMLFIRPAPNRVNKGNVTEAKPEQPKPRKEAK